MSMSFSGILKKISDAFKNSGKGIKALIFISAGVIIAGAVVISLIINNGKYTVLYRGLSATESSEILSLLDGMATDVKVDKDGSILVPTEQVAELKMQLAAEGYPNGSLDYDLFLDQSDLMTSDYEQRKLYTFQLQNRLQDSIVTIQGVKSAIVTLGIPESNSYVLKNEQVDVTASVVLELYSNASLTQKQINGIELLVTKAVPGLTSDNVVIVDGNGEQLNGSSQYSSSGADLKIDTINQINSIFEDKITEFLKPIFGKNGISISVSIKVDFNQTVSEETIYTPVIGDSGIISWVKKSSDGVTSASGTTDENGVTVYAGLDDSNSETDASQSYNAEYLVNQLVRQIQDSGGNITDMTVAVIINSSELSDEDKEKYRELVAYGAGISTDKVMLTNAPFLTDETSVYDDKPSDDSGYLLTLKLGTQEIIIISGAGLAVILIIIIIALITHRVRKRKAAAAAAKQEEKTEAAAKPDNADMPGEIILNETREQALKRQVKEFSKDNAETVAQLLRVWIKEDDNK